MRRFDHEPDRAEMLQAEEEVMVCLQRRPQTTYDMLGIRVHVEKLHIRRILRALEKTGDVAKCDPNGPYGASWWRLPGEEPALLEGEALLHVAKWAIDCSNHIGGGMSEDLAEAIKHAQTGFGVRFTRAAAEDLLQYDVRAYGYGTNRALISGRKDCDLCEQVGIAMEKVLPSLAVQRAKQAA